MLEQLVLGAWHRTDRYANNRVECDHGRLKARLRPMRGLKQDHSAKVIIAGHAYYRRKLAEGKSPKEALRCLKRRLSDAVYRCLLADQTCSRSSTGQETASDRG